MFIVDAQAHIWHKVRRGAEDQAHRPEPFGADELLREMDTAGVSQAILVPTSWSDDNGNELVVKAAQEHPDRFGVFGVLPMAAANGPEFVARWKDTSGLLGVRASFYTEALAPLLTDGTADWFWPSAERASVPVMIYAPGQLETVGQIARKHPNLRLIVDHLGQPRLSPDIDHEAHLQALLKLAPLSNVAAKASAMPQYSREPYPFQDMQPLVCRALEAFGPERTFWGSDLTRLRGVTYTQAVTMFTNDLPCLTGAGKELVMGRALCDWIGWQ